MKRFPLWIAGAPVETGRWISVSNKYSQTTVFEVARASTREINQAIEAAQSAIPSLAELASYERTDCLIRLANELRERAEEMALVLSTEVGKTIREARAEVERALHTIRLGAEEATRFGGEILPIDVVPRAKGYWSMWKRFPIGPCSFISPFNFPLNLAAHKIVPAIAVGCPFILKPATNTPVSALLLGEMISKINLPKGSFSILPCQREDAELFVTDDRLKFLSFTGSASVGWELKNRAGRKKVSLELGGNAACLIEEDADVDDSAKRCVSGAFAMAGQSCISVQRIFIRESQYQKFREKFIEQSSKIIYGDPSQETTAMGPMISESEASRLEGWIAEAKKAGARELLGGARKGALFPPTVLEAVPASCKVSCEEAFGPVVIFCSIKSFEEGLRQMNSSRFGLQAGLFTRDIERISKAWNQLEVGGVMINEIPSWRIDHMPYGGVKDSGLGREGVRWAMEEMSEVRLLAIRSLP